MCYFKNDQHVHWDYQVIYHVQPLDFLSHVYLFAMEHDKHEL
jgi:hypothetical protein